MEKKYIHFSDEEASVDSYRRKVAEEVPSLLFKATLEYQEFVNTHNSHDVKSFAAYQAACRSALTHLQLLIKLAAWAQPHLGKDMLLDEDSELDQMILDARAEINDCFDQKY